MSIGLARLREEPERIRQGAIDKGEDPSIVDAALALEANRRQLLGDSDSLKADRNAASKKIGEAIRAGAASNGPEVAALKQASTEAGTQIEKLNAELAAAEAQLEELMLRIPNPADPDVPVGDGSANQTVRTWGELLPKEVTADGLGVPDGPAPPGPAGLTGKSQPTSRCSTWSVAQRSRAPVSPCTRAPAPASSAPLSTSCSTSTRKSTA